MRTSRSGALWLAILTAGALLRWAGVPGKVILTHDETVSYISATGHQGEYARTVNAKTAPYGAWVTRGQWMRFVEIGEPFCWRTIRDDLVTWDLHPPLYFWLLHLFILLFGTHVWSGPLLNTALAVLTALLIRQAGLRMGYSPSLAQTAAALWLLSPALTGISLEARPYDLLALCTAAFVVLLLRFFHEPHNRTVRLGLSGITLLGSLSHHHFGLVAAGAIAFMLIRPGEAAARRHAFSLLALVAVGYLLATTAGLDIAQAWRASRREVPPLELTHLGTRLEAVFLALAGFFSQFKIAKYLLSVAFIVLWVRQRRCKKAAADTNGERRFLRFMAVWSLGWTFLLFWLGVSPAHAMGEKYLAIAWPFAALLLADFAHRAWERRSVKWALGIGGATMLLSSLLRLVPAAAGLPVCLNTASSVVVDTAARGELLRLVWHVPGTAMVYAAAQADLVADPAWPGRVDRNTLYISRLRAGNTRSHQKQILARWPQGCSPRHQPSAFDKIGAGVWCCTPDDFQPQESEK